MQQVVPFHDKGSFLLIWGDSHVRTGTVIEVGRCLLFDCASMECTLCIPLMLHAAMQEEGLACCNAAMMLQCIAALLHAGRRPRML